MPAFGPVKRTQLVAYLRRLGFEGPLAGTRHQVMIRGGSRVRIPNPHQGDLSRGMLARILREADISREEWEQL